MRTRMLTTRKLRGAGDLGELRAWLRAELSVHADRSSVADVVVATQEAVTNSLRSRRQTTRPVKVRLDVDDDYLWIEVEDSGGGFLGAEPRCELPSADEVHGRGLYLMRTLMDVLEISSRPAGSRVRMGKRIERLAG